jgi:hypothetical protein
MLRGLTEAGIEFVVVGGVASVLAGSPRVTNDLDICYDPSDENISRLALLLGSWSPYPRGVEPGLPFPMDERTFRVTPLMTLRTIEGDIDLLDRVEGVGSFDEAMKAAVEYEVFGIRFHALDLPALIASKRAASRPKDLAQLPELEALLALRSR